MPISRPLLIVLIAAVLAAVGFYATQGARQSSDSSTPVVDSPPASKPATADATTARVDRKPRPKPAVAGVPPKVQRALDAHQLVVLFFYASGPADDRATARAVASLRGERGTSVFSDPIRRLSDYRGLIADLGISQAPAVVIVGKDRTARVIQGYIDPATLAQDVADSR